MVAKKLSVLFVAVIICAVGYSAVSMNTPSDPIEPTDPEIPTTPTDPEIPTTPTDPEIPTTPTDPDPIIQYTLSYNANAGSDSTYPPILPSTTHLAGTSAIVIDGIERNDYYFVEWNPNPDGSGGRLASFFPGDSITMNSDITLYAKWE